MKISVEKIFQFHHLRTQAHIDCLNYFAGLLGYHFPEQRRRERRRKSLDGKLLLRFSAQSRMVLQSRRNGDSAGRTDLRLRHGQPHHHLSGIAGDHRHRSASLAGLHPRTPGGRNGGIRRIRPFTAYRSGKLYGKSPKSLRRAPSVPAFGGRRSGCGGDRGADPQKKEISFPKEQRITHCSFFFL